MMMIVYSAILGGGSPMSHVDYKKLLCHPVEFKKRPCRPGDFKKRPCHMSLRPKRAMSPCQLYGSTPITTILLYQNSLPMLLFAKNR